MGCMINKSKTSTLAQWVTIWCVWWLRPDGTTSAEWYSCTILSLVSLLAYQNSFIDSGTGDNNDTIAACDNSLQKERKAGCWAAKSVFTEACCGMQLPGAWTRSRPWSFANDCLALVEWVMAAFCFNYLMSFYKLSAFVATFLHACAFVLMHGCAAWYVGIDRSHFYFNFVSIITPTIFSHGQCSTATLFGLRLGLMETAILSDQNGGLRDRKSRYKLLWRPPRVSVLWKLYGLGSYAAHC